MKKLLYILLEIIWTAFILAVAVYVCFVVVLPWMN